MELRRLNTTGLFWSIFDDSTISAGNRGTILRIESVLDRLALISKALEGDEGHRLCERHDRERLQRAGLAGAAFHRQRCPTIT